MRRSVHEPRLLIPALGPLYDRIGEWSYPFIRIVCGLTMLPHGWAKFTDPQVQASDTVLMHKLGFEPAAGFYWFIACVELFGGALLTLGLFTRVVAFLLACELMVITFDVFLRAGRPIEFTLLWGLVIFAFCWRGGGRYSLDHLIGREL